MPEADDLFRPTGEDAPAAPSKRRSKDVTPEESASGASGRVRHDEKITVYVTSAELNALEQARLTLRAEHGVAADRGRLVRTAIALALADLQENGADSQLIRRLIES